MLLVLAKAGACQDVPRSKPSFAIEVGAERAEFNPGASVPVKLTMTNTSDHDLRFSVMVVQCRPLINVPVTVRQVQVQLYDGEGNPVPLTVYGKVVQGRSGAGREQSGVDREHGVGCGGGGTLGILKPGESRIEEADLSKEFDIKKPGMYTIHAQRFDRESKTVVKSKAITLKFSTIQ